MVGLAGEMGEMGVVVGIGPGLLGRLVVVVASGPRQRRLP